MEWKLKKFNELSSVELYEILNLRAEVFVVEQECPYQDIDYKDQKSYHLCAYESGKLMGYIRILEKGVSYDEISIGRVIVKKEYRGKNLARELMTRGINFIKETLKEEEIRISAQAYLVNFYGSLGFKQVSEVYLEDEIPHIEMVYK